jgi:ABC-2 type transport system permease protein
MLLENLVLYRFLLLAQLRSTLQYRVSFILDVLGTSLVTILEFAAFALIFSRFQGLGGWSLLEIMFLYGMVEFAFGLTDMVFDGFDSPTFSQHIRKGTLDQFLLRPANLMIQIFGSSISFRRIGRVILGAGIFGYALLHNPQIWQLEKILYLPLVILGMNLYFGALFLVGAAITIFTTDSTDAMNLFTYGGKDMMSYPMNIYADWLRIMFTFLFPVALVNYYPALFFLGKPDPFGLPSFMPFLAPVAGFMMFLLALQFWKFGLKHYQSAGN